MFYGLGSDLKIIIFVPLDPNPESVINFGFEFGEAIENGSNPDSDSASAPVPHLWLQDVVILVWN